MANGESGDASKQPQKNVPGRSLKSLYQLEPIPVSVDDRYIELR